MFHVVFSIASRFLHFGNLLQGFARELLTLRSLGLISSHLIPSLPPPLPTPLLDAPVPLLELPEEIIPPYPSGGLIAIERIGRQPPVFASPISSYQYSLITASFSQLPRFLPLFIMLAIIPGFIVLLPRIVNFFMNVAKIPSAFTHASRYIPKSFTSKPISHFLPASLSSQFPSSRFLISLVSLVLLWTGPPVIASFSTIIWIMFILLSQDQGSNMIAILLQRCGLLAVQDTTTPPLLNVLYEQIIHGASGYNDLVGCSNLSYEHSEDQVIADGSLGYSHLAHDEKLDKYRLRLQHIYTQFVDSQNGLRQQLELSRAREQRLHADLLAAEHERKRLKALISTFEESDEKRRRWKEIATKAKARCVEAEATVSKLREDLAAVMDRVCSVQEQLDRQTELASSKDHIIQSVTEESQVARIRLKYAEDKVEHLNAKLKRERDRRLRETKELLDEQVRVQNCHESEMRHLKQEAQDAQEQLDTLRDTTSRLRAQGRSPLDRDHPPRCQQPTTGQYDTGQPPLPPEQNLDTGTPPINLDSSLRSTNSSPYSPSQDREDSSTSRVAHLIQISACFDPASEGAQDQAALEESFERMRQGESEGAQDAVNPNGERDENRLQEELATTKEQLRLAEEEVLTVRRDLHQSREILRDVKTHVMLLESEWEMCKVMLRESQDARRTSMTKLAEIVELLRVSQVESESSMAEAEESRFTCSQVKFLCAALQERVTELETEVKKSRYSTRTSAHSDFCPFIPADTRTTPSGVETATHDPDLQDFDSIYMAVSPRLPRLLDLSLPPSPSSSISSSFYFNPQKCSAILSARADFNLFRSADTCTDLGSYTRSPKVQDFNSIHVTVPQRLSRRLDLSLPPSWSSSNSLCPADSDVNAITHSDSYLLNLSLALQSCDPDIRYYEVDLPAAVDPGKANHEPTNLGRLLSSPLSEGLSLLPPSVQPRTFLSERNSLGSVDWPPIGSSLLPGRGQDNDIGIQTEESVGDSIVLDQETSPSPFHESEQVLDRRHVISNPKTRVLPRSSSTPGVPPVSSRGSQITHSSRQDCSSVTNALLSSASRSRDVPIRPLRLSPPSPIINFALPMFLPPAGTWERHIALSIPRNNYGDTVTGNVAPDPLCKISSSVQNGDFRSTARAPHDGTQLMFPGASILNALGSPPSKFSMQSCRGAPGSHSSDVVTIQSGSAPGTFRLPSKHFAAGSSSSGLPAVGRREAPLADWDQSHSSNTVQHLPTQPFGILRAPLAREDAETQAVKRTTKSMPRLSPPRLLPGLLDPVTIDSNGTALTDNDSPCAFGKLREGGRPNQYRRFSRPRDIPRLDYGLPGDFVPGFAPERQAIDLDDFAFVIPLDCATSTPVAARKRASHQEKGRVLRRS